MAIRAGDVQPPLLAPPALAARERVEVARADAPVGAEGEVVRERRHLGAPRRPATTRRLEHPGFLRIRDQEAVVVAGAVGLEGRASLPVRLEERRNRLERFARIASSLETEPHEVHPDQAGGVFDGLPREDRVVADRDAVLVDAVLEAPDPPGRVPHYAIGLGHLRNCDVGAAELGAAGMDRRGELHQGLALSLLPVAVLGEDRGAVARPGTRGDEGIAHGRRVSDPLPVVALIRERGEMRDEGLPGQGGGSDGRRRRRLSGDVETMSPILKGMRFLARSVRGTWLAFGFTLLLVMVFEGCTRLLFHAKDALVDPYVGWCDRIMGADAYRDARWPAEYCKEHEGVVMEWHPYTYWRRRPLEAQHINVDERGFRRTWNQPVAPGRCGADRVRIFVLGGSTIWGPAVRDDYTVPSHLSKLLAEGDLCVEVLNLGETGYVSTQELILLQIHLQRGDIPDLVVFYDGVNELFSAYQNGEVGLPQNEDHRRREFNFLLDPERVRDAYLAQLMKPEGLSRLRDAVQKRLRSAESVGGAGLQPQQSAVMEELPNPDELITQMLVVYKSNIEMIRLLSSHYGFDALFYWQPLIFTKETLSPYERESYEVASGQWKDFLVAAYERVDEDVQLNQVPVFHNLAAVFDELEDPYYVDAFHLTEDGNGVVAREIAKDVTRVLQASPRPDES